MTEFSKNIRKLREEKKISQKSAAASLGVSQALLSHYEKGIRECGLNFLARVAGYYGVSTDYLLGLCGDISDVNAAKANEAVRAGSKKDSDPAVNTYSVSALHKNLIVHALNYLFGSMRDPEYSGAAVLSGKYLSLAIYRICGILYSGVYDSAHSGHLAERHLIAELKYITELGGMNAPLGKYDFGSVYLNNIIKNVEL